MGEPRNATRYASESIARMRASVRPPLPASASRGGNGDSFINSFANRTFQGQYVWVTSHPITIALGMLPHRHRALTWTDRWTESSPPSAFARTEYTHAPTASTQERAGERLSTGWVVLDAELMPWLAKAQGHIRE